MQFFDRLHILPFLYNININHETQCRTVDRLERPSSVIDKPEHQLEKLKYFLIVVYMNQKS